MSQEVLVFDEDKSGPVIVPVVVGGKKFELREAMGEAACHIRQKMFELTKIGPDGLPTDFTRIADMDPIVVASCLYFSEGEQAGNKVDVSYVRMNFRPKTISSLSEKVKEISELDLDENSIESIDKQIALLEKRKEKLYADQQKLKNS